MRNMKSALVFATMISLALGAIAVGAGEQKFRADGTLQRISSDRVLVRTSTADIDITRDAKTKVTGEVRRGAAATVFYTKVSGQNYATEIVMGGPAKPK
jgi:hypothetical protein